MLQTITTYDESPFLSRAYAQDEFNARGNIIFEQTETFSINDPNRGLLFVTVIWYTKIEPKEKEEPKKVFEYIGSIDIDPNDPNWQEQWDNASVGSQEGSGATEEEK